MGRTSISFEKITCDNCSYSQIFEKYQKPNGWTHVWTVEEGGGHYGLPHHHTDLYFCPKCKEIGKNKDDKNQENKKWLISFGIEYYENKQENNFEDLNKLLEF